MIDRTMVMHTLNCDHAEFDAIAEGRKTFEVRLDDRDYRVGDRLDLRRAGPREVREMHELGRRALEGALPAVDADRLEELRSCPRQRALIVWKVRLTGAVVPAEPHWWKPVEAMQHGVAVMGIELEEAG